MSDRSSSNCSQNGHDSATCLNDNVKLLGDRPRLADGSIRRSASMGHISNHNDRGLPDEKSGHEDGYATASHMSISLNLSIWQVTDFQYLFDFANCADNKDENLYILTEFTSKNQFSIRDHGILRTEEGHRLVLPGLQISAQEPMSPREDDVMTEEELNARVETLIKKFYSQMQKRKPVEALSPKEDDDMIEEEELNARVEAFIEKFYLQMQKRKPVEQPWWKILDFAALKQSPVSFFNTEEPETAVTRWAKARKRAAKNDPVIFRFAYTFQDDSNDRTSIDILPETENDDEAHQRRDGSSTRKVALDKIFVIGNFVLELPSAVFDQLSSLHKPQYALLSMLTSFAAILICVIELVLKGREGQVTWRPWRGKIPWLYYAGHGNKPFATFTDIIGLVCAIFQGIFTSITYAFYCRHADSPVKISAWPLVFAFGLLCSKVFNKSEKKATLHESQD
ncbi:hypothetical protein JRO89_XS02G0228000 [Xanthoceras sorbifolium]|uniref:Uncharacterized protein n=1 Tax=Xanthoceras sorbifolium TaxID=99658 RepID=A0ABQ8IH34_9ROSI|nr:hypothetical protein JRO89_XS02G0228000 [Xanthoceras sorbifolium]